MCLYTNDILQYLLKGIDAWVASGANKGDSLTGTTAAGNEGGTGSRPVKAATNGKGGFGNKK